MTARLYDAHNHLADRVFDAERTEIDTCLRSIGMVGAVVNGTSPEDWPRVLKLAGEDKRLVPAVGLHPWKVNEAPADWKDRFMSALESGARAVGEIGLDRWIEDHDMDRQQAAFRWQLAQAEQRDLPVSIHCLKATGPLMQTLRAVALPQRGIHLHAFRASREIIEELCGLGAYFSFNGSQMVEGRVRDIETIRAVPLERLLVETDAPDMTPPDELREFELPDADGDKSLNHPGNLRRAYLRMADLRGVSPESLAASVEENYQHFFSGS